jgi:hypothetical protein
MGSLQATEMAELTDLETALTWHLRANHYPPVPLEMLEVCKEAIALCNEGLENNTVDLPLGVRYRNDTYAPAWAIVDGHNLHPWIQREDD